MRKRDVYYWQERSILNKLDQEWKEHLVFKIIDENEIQGIGASTPNKEFGETFKTSMAIVESLRKITENFHDLKYLVEFENKINSFIKKDMSAKTTVLLAVYDYISKRNNINIEHFYFDFNSKHKKVNFERIFLNENFEFIPSKNKKIKLDIKNYIETDKLIETISLYKDKELILDFSGLYSSFELDYLMKKLENLNIVALEQPTKHAQEKQMKKFLKKGYKIYWDESFHNIADLDRIKDYSTGFVFTLSKMSSLSKISNLLKLVQFKGYETIISSELEHPINLDWSNKISKAFDIIDLNFSKYIKKTNK
ncbi:MAG: hypothetical protein ACQESN_04200 [Thermotogota bacterium]